MISDKMFNQAQHIIKLYNEEQFIINNSNNAWMENLNNIARLILLQVQHNIDCGKDDKFTIDEIAEIINRRVVNKSTIYDFPYSPLFDDVELKRLIWEEWESEIKGEDPRVMVFKYMKMMRGEFFK